MKKILTIIFSFVALFSIAQVNIGSNGRVHSSSTGGTVTPTNELTTGTDTISKKNGLAYVNSVLYVYYGGKWNISAITLDTTSISYRINQKLNFSDSNAMLAPYARSAFYIPLSQKAANNGVATLDAGGKVPISELPSSLMIYKGLWDAYTNAPHLDNSTGTQGWVYQISNSNGTYVISSVFGATDTLWNGDFIMYNGSTWEVSSGTENVKSVSINGSTAQQGIVALTVPNASITDAMLQYARLKISDTAATAYIDALAIPSGY